jgi:hypothetical protein
MEINLAAKASPPHSRSIAISPMLCLYNAQSTYT